jgi:hypothetical protein
MLLVRTIIVIGVGVALLPTDEAQQRRLQAATRDAYTRVVTFCDRNAETCRSAAGYWQTFVRKAEFGGRLLLDVVLDRPGQPPEARRHVGLEPAPPLPRRQPPPER